MWRAFQLIFLLSMPCVAQNLLANPGFEQLDGVVPARWNVYVMPMAGAEGILSEEVPQEGRFCVKLHNPQPYEHEPVNNWSQSVIAQVAGKSMRVQGYIRTKGATEAAIWVQCFQRSPWGVVGFATSSSDMPRYGTSDWERVEVKLDVPASADFLMVRCVLKGEGTAWFDHLSVESVTSAVAEDAEPTPVASEAPVPQIPPPAAPSTANEIPLSKQEEALAKVLQSHEEMLERYQTLRESNTLLQEHIEQMRQQIETLKSLLDSSQMEKSVPSTPSPVTTPPESLPDRPVSPLVPRIEAMEEGTSNTKVKP